MKTELNLLDNLQVASPCDASWEEMTGDDFVRFCSHCSKNVYNLSALTRDAALELIREREGNLCGRFFRRADGTVLTADCPVGVHHKAPRKRRSAVFAGALAGLMGLAGCSNFDSSSGTSTATPPSRQTAPEKQEVVLPGGKGDFVMGKICEPEDIRRAPEPIAGGPAEQLPVPREKLD